ncbi:hypothetical protein NUH88_10030 [Nisaea acidiphila]|uniref:Lipoprotein n=1 Tax=Nisaea acidiphila TaxID=1862145 RepID=A0A9J7AXB8_9PROT|nr:hypothetical protein [Nisaea acidiphila]UUX52023.1 hypothetical protein NUH88_10030 [Nisaea acidiphila]
MEISRPAVFRGLAFAALAMLLLAGCREHEQNRVLLYKKGTYLGAEDQSLSEETLSEIRNRGRRQSFDL